MDRRRGAGQHAGGRLERRAQPTDSLLNAALLTSGQPWAELRDSQSLGSTGTLSDVPPLPSCARAPIIVQGTYAPEYDDMPPAADGQLESQRLD